MPGVERKEIEKRGMKLLIAVGQGSVNEPRFVHISYTPKRAKKKLVFVGKGLTFDSGGLCIKPAPGMGEMKSDMAGAANVVGLMAAIAAVKPDVEVHGIIASAGTCPTPTLTGRAMSSARSTARRSGSSTPMPRVGSFSPTRWPTRALRARRSHRQRYADRRVRGGAGQNVLRLLCNGRAPRHAVRCRRQRWPASSSGGCPSRRSEGSAEERHCRLEAHWRTLGRIDHRGALLARVRRQMRLDPRRHRWPGTRRSRNLFYSKGGTGHGVLTFLHRGAARLRNRQHLPRPSASKNAYRVRCPARSTTSR